MTHAAPTAHPHGVVGWLNELRPLAADLEQDRGREAVQALFHDTLKDLLPVIDKRLSLAPPAPGQADWIIHREASEPRRATPPHEPEPRSLYRAILGEACTLLRQHDPDKARRKLDGAGRDLWLEFKTAFIPRLQDPAAAFGYSPISLSIDSPSVKPANEAASLQWLDCDFGIARRYLPDLHDYRGDSAEGLARETLIYSFRR